VKSWHVLSHYSFINKDLFLFPFFLSFFGVGFQNVSMENGEEGSHQEQQQSNVLFGPSFFSPSFFFLPFLNWSRLKLNSLHQHMAKVEVRQIKRFISPKNG